MDSKLQTAVAMAFSHTMHVTKSIQHSDSLFQCTVCTRRLRHRWGLSIASQAYVGQASGRHSPGCSSPLLESAWSWCGVGLMHPCAMLEHLPLWLLSGSVISHSLHLVCIVPAIPCRGYRPHTAHTRGQQRGLTDVLSVPVGQQIPGVRQMVRGASAGVLLVQLTQQCCSLLLHTA